MALLISMLPLYLFGNLHCFGMCGPIVMMISKHRYRMFYFVGRIIAFSIFGLLSSAFGIVLKMAFHGFNGAAALSFIFGLVFLAFAIGSLKPNGNMIPHYLGKTLSRLSLKLNLLLLQDKPETTFYFGLATPLLPCGQSLYVFSISAILEDPFLGMLNGCIFAVLTSPSLYAALRLHKMLTNSKKHYMKAMTFSALLAATLAFLRGFAELGFISHLSYESTFFHGIHLVLF